MKKIVIFSSRYTGHGHQSISQALTEQLAQYPDVEVSVIEGFELIGSAAVRASKMYGSLTRRAKDMWGMTYLLSSQTPRFIAEFMEMMIHDKLMHRLKSDPPDLLVSVHSLFNSGVLNILEQYRIDIPMITLQADIIDIHPSWCDPRALYTLCPTPEAMSASVRLGMPSRKLKMCGFPVRARFCQAARGANRPDYEGKRRLRCLLMSGGEGSGNLRRYAQILLSQLDTEVTVICGRNEQLRNTLDDLLTPQFGDRVQVLGFCENVQEHMLRSDILIARGSPNTLMEGIVCNVPLVITGALPGQESHNPKLMVSHNLGVECASPKVIQDVVSDLLKNNAEKLREIRAAQRAYRDFDTAKRIAAFLYENVESKERYVPNFKPRFPTLYPYPRPAHVGRATTGGIWKRRKD